MAKDWENEKRNFSPVDVRKLTGNFASEIGPSRFFGAYQCIKTLESRGKFRDEVMKALLEKHGENNPEVNVTPQDGKRDDRKQPK